MKNDYLWKPKKPRASRPFMVGKQDEKCWITDGSYMLDVTNIADRLDLIFRLPLKECAENEGFNVSYSKGTISKIQTFPRCSQLMHAINLDVCSRTTITSDFRGIHFGPVRLFVNVATGKNVWLDDWYIQEILHIYGVQHLNDFPAITFSQSCRSSLAPVFIRVEGVLAAMIMPMDIKTDPLEFMKPKTTTLEEIICPS